VTRYNVLKTKAGITADKLTQNYATGSEKIIPKISFPPALPPLEKCLEVHSPIFQGKLK